MAFHDHARHDPCTPACPAHGEEVAFSDERSSDPRDSFTAKRTFDCSLGSVVAITASDGAIHRAKVRIELRFADTTHGRYVNTMPLGDAMALRDLISKAIHAALSMTVNANTRSLPSDV